MKKGFATSAILYTMLLLFLVLMVGILNNLQNKKTVLDALKTDTIHALDGNTCEDCTQGKILISAAITNKGIPTLATDTFEVMADNISQIQTGMSEQEAVNTLVESLQYSDYGFTSDMSLQEIMDTFKEKHPAIINLLPIQAGTNFVAYTPASNLCTMTINTNNLYFNRTTTSWGNGALHTIYLNTYQNEPVDLSKYKEAVITITTNGSFAVSTSMSANTADVVWLKSLDKDQWNNFSNFQVLQELTASGTYTINIANVTSGYLAVALRTDGNPTGSLSVTKFDLYR